LQDSKQSRGVKAIFHWCQIGVTRRTAKLTRLAVILWRAETKMSQQAQNVVLKVVNFGSFFLRLWRVVWFLTC